MVDLGPNEPSCLSLNSGFFGVAPNISWFLSASREDVLVSSVLQPFLGGPDQDASSVVIKGILAQCSLLGRQDSRDGPSCIIKTCIQRPISH